MRPSSAAAVRALKRAKPLYFFLKTEYYEAFEAGTKTSELRAEGGQFNEVVCFPGREAFVSKGYGKKHRLPRVIVSTTIYEHGSKLPAHYRESALKLYGTLDKRFIEIHMEKPLVLFV